MQFFVYHSPEMVPTDRLPDCAIAVDVLRATTTIATALHAGAEGIQVFSDIQELMRVSEDWDPEHRLRVGERGGKMVEGCDVGNSPLDCTPERVKGVRLFMSTTNGTRALKGVQASPVVLTAALINRDAVVQYLYEHQPKTVWIVCSGWEGSFSLEDTVCAGAVVEGIRAASNASLLDVSGNDEAIAAVALYCQFQDSLLSLLQLASHGQRLLRLNLLDDLQYCAQIDQLDVLPIQKDLGVLVKHQN